MLSIGGNVTAQGLNQIRPTGYRPIYLADAVFSFDLLPCQHSVYPVSAPLKPDSN